VSIRAAFSVVMKLEDNTASSRSSFDGGKCKHSDATETTSASSTGIVIDRLTINRGWNRNTAPLGTR